jgi:hypothetical protein
MLPDAGGVLRGSPGSFLPILARSIRYLGEAYNVGRHTTLSVFPCPRPCYTQFQAEGDRHAQRSY